MKITSVTVHYARTQSLPGYSNVKHGISLTAEVEDDESGMRVEQTLLDHIKAAVHEQIDTALEAADEPAVYSADPRFDVAWINPVFAIVPAGQIPANGRRYRSGLRLAHARRYAAEMAAATGDVVVECCDGDLSRIPVDAPHTDDDEGMTVAEFLAPINAMANETVYGVDYDVNEVTYGYEDGDDDPAELDS